MNGNKFSITLARWWKRTRTVPAAVSIRLRPLFRAALAASKRLHPEAAVAIVLAGFFIMSAGFLFWKIDRDLSSDAGKDYWIVAFERRGDFSSGFFIENHSGTNEFSYTVSAGGTEIASGTVDVASGAKRTIALPASDAAGRISVVVRDVREEKRSIYLER